MKDGKEIKAIWYAGLKKGMLSLLKEISPDSDVDSLLYPIWDETLWKILEGEERETWEKMSPDEKTVINEDGLGFKEFKSKILAVYPT